MQGISSEHTTGRPHPSLCLLHLQHYSLDINEIQSQESELGCHEILIMVPASSMQVNLLIHKLKTNSNDVNKMALYTENCT